MRIDRDLGYGRMRRHHDSIEHPSSEDWTPLVRSTGASGDDCESLLEEGLQPMQIEELENLMDGE